MIKEEIFEGLKVALSKGESLQRAMMSFFNAGYSKEEIEEAARYLQASQASAQPQTSQPAKQVTQPVQQQHPKPQSKIKQLWSPQKPIKQTVQKVSAYERKPKSTSIIVTGILIFLLILLLGILVAVFLFKDKLAAFFSNIL
jgi:FtsZ-interacting cell division protein ZipA